MRHHGDPATTTTAGETCSFNCCISLCMRPHDPLRSRGGEHFVKEVGYHVAYSVEGVATVSLPLTGPK